MTMYTKIGAVTWVLLVLAVQLRGQDSLLLAVIDTLNAHPNVVQTDFAETITTTASTSGRCRLALARLTTVKFPSKNIPREQGITYDPYDLGLLDPNGTIAGWGTPRVYSVRFTTASGDSSLVWRADGKPPRASDYFMLELPDSDVAAGVAADLGRAITGCGGRPRSAAVAAAALASDPATNPAFDKPKRDCRDMVRAQLRDPASASFTEYVVVGLVNAQLHMLASVTSHNAYGANVTNSFACNFKLDGGLWIPTGPPLVF